ncbi:YebC/PmpR family DNA-binding transcriptional regulator [candidate division FCPU426 bacterium]|nr:YebC/PmpR family DNA-binding transcriptional regulator [candidate division FCPU426 bacterium]
MSGHSKWATIKRSKAAVDAKKGKIFTRLTKEIIQAAKTGGGNPELNSRLRTAVNAARAANMPQDNIKRAIMKGTGELAGEAYEEIVYEGYGPGGVAIMVEITTDNKNRSASDIRSIFTKRNGNMGEPGSVAWMFEKKGQIVLNKSEISEDDLLSLVLEAGAEDITSDETTFTVTVEPNHFDNVFTAVKSRLEPVSAEITMVPKTVMTVDDPKNAEALLKLLESLEDHDDVQKVHSNFDIPDEIMESLKEN